MVKVIFYDKETAKKAQGDYYESLSDSMKRSALSEGTPVWIGTNLGKHIERLEKIYSSYRKEYLACRNDDDQDVCEIKMKRCDKLRNKLIKLVDDALNDAWQKTKLNKKVLK